DIRSALPRRTALVDLIEYWHLDPAARGHKGWWALERRVAAFVVRPDREKCVLVSLGRYDELEKLVELWRASYAVGKQPAPGKERPPADCEACFGSRWGGAREGSRWSWSRPPPRRPGWRG